MIYEVGGDILLSEAAVVAHGVAPNDTISRLDWRSGYGSGGPRCTKTFDIIARFPIRSPVSYGVGPGLETCGLSIF